jgi:cystathionine gamma-synthase
VVLASNFHAEAMAAPGSGQDSRAYSRTDATLTWEALEMAVGRVEGGHAVAFSSGMAAIAAVLDIVPAGGRIVAPADCYFGVGELLADARGVYTSSSRVRSTGLAIFPSAFLGRVSSMYTSRGTL